jgi:glucokinase
MTEKFICFDIGGTKIFESVVEVDFGRRKFEFLDSKTIENPVDVEKIEKIITEYCQESQVGFETNKIAISTSKIVDYEKQIVREASPVYGVESFDFDFLKKAGFQAVIENDGKAFALAEHYFEDNEDGRGLLTLTLGTGLGGGFVSSGGQILRGKDGSAMEISHIKMFIDGEWVRWENISGGQGIERMYQKSTGEAKKAQEIFAEAENNEEARMVIEKSQEYLGHGIANLINIFNPEKIVFGGSVSSQKAFLEGALKISQISIFDKNAMPEWSVSELKEEMNVLGVCALYYI